MWCYGREGILCSLAFSKLFKHPSFLLTWCLSGSCVKCSKGVFGAGQACQAMGDLYHDACFTCAACSKCAAVGVERGTQAKRVGRGKTVEMEP
jgi:hypothetical protein